MQCAGDFWMTFFKKDEVLIRSKQNLSNPGKCIKLNIFSDVIKQQTPFHRINLKKSNGQLTLTFLSGFVKKVKHKNKQLIFEQTKCQIVNQYTVKKMRYKLLFYNSLKEFL